MYSLGVQPKFFKLLLEGDLIVKAYLVANFGYWRFVILSKQKCSFFYPEFVNEVVKVLTKGLITLRVWLPGNPILWATPNNFRFGFRYVFLFSTWSRLILIWITKKGQTRISQTQGNWSGGRRIDCQKSDDEQDGGRATIPENNDLERRIDRSFWENQDTAVGRKGKKWPIARQRIKVTEQPKSYPEKSSINWTEIQANWRQSVEHVPIGFPKVTKNYLSSWPKLVRALRNEKTPHLREGFYFVAVWTGCFLINLTFH